MSMRSARRQSRSRRWRPWRRDSRGLSEHAAVARRSARMWGGISLTAQENAQRDDDDVVEVSKDRHEDGLPLRDAAISGYDI
ncbi:hypothetical protein LPU83_pLPU83c_0070 (plasmid) [Rhizobium favelukesii]|uniref:Uncharacterized protein n=1 Tax=Rhizobium favelukesii TaxID=348824 RepID=W6RHH7_9HYPH|nr:hypothetical protein LPU83_pLPU83c_0070 [Rhizobium favelukesii]